MRSNRSTARVWHPFMADSCRYAWRKSFIVGVLAELGRDIHRSWQRVWRGYCDYDLFSIFDWFLEIMPEMLKEYKDTRHGSPVMDGNYMPEPEPGNSGRADANEKAWDAVLDRVIFLLGEAGEETCSRKNPFEEAYDRALDEFQRKYGTFGEQLDDERDKRSPGKRMHFPDEVPEYQEISKNYFEEEKKLAEYRSACKDELFQLFSRWFYDLWDLRRR